MVPRPQMRFRQTQLYLYALSFWSCCQNYIMKLEMSSLILSKQKKNTHVSFPTPSKMASTPSLFVSSNTLFTVSSTGYRMTWAAPCALARSAFAWVEVVPITIAPIRLPSWAKSKPRPPATVWTRIVSPFFTLYASSQKDTAVMPCKREADATWVGIEEGTGKTDFQGTEMYVACIPRKLWTMVFLRYVWVKCTTTEDVQRLLSLRL